MNNIYYGGSASITPETSLRPSLLHLAAYFLHLGAVGFGGPVALAGRMETDLVERRQWISETQYSDGLALAQLAPGPLAAQLAMYLGYVLHGVWGATAVAIAFIAPSFLMVVLIGALYVAYGGLPIVQGIFYGVGPAVIAIIGVASARLANRLLRRDTVLWLIFAVMAVTTALTARENMLLFVSAGFLTVLVRERVPFRPMAVSMLPIASVVSEGEVPRIFVFFLKSALFVFGSGLAIVPFLYAGVVQEHHWLTEQQFVDAVAVAMITPGPVVITVAFIGYLVAGLPGAIAAAAGVFLPVYLVVVLLAPVYKRVAANPNVRAFVAGVTAAATGALAGAVLVLARKSIHNLAEAAIFAGAMLLLLLRRKVPEPAIIVIAAIIGVLARRALL